MALVSSVYLAVKNAIYASRRWRPLAAPHAALGGPHIRRLGCGGRRAHTLRALVRAHTLRALVRSSNGLGEDWFMLNLPVTPQVSPGQS
jgi:hypothetical protein